MENDVNRLARLTLEHKQGKTVYEAEALAGLIGALTWHSEDDPHISLPGADAVTVEDTYAGLRIISHERRYLDRNEALVIEAAKDRGATWEQLGQELDPPVSGQASQQRYKRLGGKKSWPSTPPRRGTPTQDA